MDPIVTTLSLLVLYQLKHFLADYPLQSRYMLGKFKDGWGFVLPLLAHVGVHGWLTFCIALGVTGYVFFALELAVLDAAVHFVMDRIKASPKYLGRFKPLTAHVYRRCAWRAADATVPMWRRERALARIWNNTFFWWSLGLDQMVHHLTHYGLIYLMLRSKGWVP